MEPINPPIAFWHFSLYGIIFLFFFADFLQSYSPSSTAVVLNDGCISHPLLPEATNLSLTAPLTLLDASEATHLWWKIKHQWDLLPLLPVFNPEPFKHTLVQRGFKNEYLPTRLKAGAYDGTGLPWRRQRREGCDTAASVKIYCAHSFWGFHKFIPGLLARLCHFVAVCQCLEPVDTPLMQRVTSCSRYPLM